MRQLPLLSLLLLATPALAQVPEKAADFLETVRPAVPSLAAVGFEWHDTHDFQDGSGDASWNIYELRAPVAFNKFRGDQTLSLGVDLSVADLDISSGADSWSGQLYGLYLPVTYTRRVDDGRWFWIGQVAPGLRTDFESIGSDDFAIRAFGSVMRQVTDTFSFGVGAFVSHDVDQLFAVPGIGFTWKPDDAWLLSLIPPQLALSYQPSDAWIFALAMRPSSYLADLDPGEDDPDFASVKFGRLTLSAKSRLTDADGPDLWLALRAGYTLYSEVELRRGGRALEDGDLDQGFFAGASLELMGW